MAAHDSSPAVRARTECILAGYDSRFIYFSRFALTTNREKFAPSVAKRDNILMTIQSV